MNMSLTTYLLPNKISQFTNFPFPSSILPSTNIPDRESKRRKLSVFHYLTRPLHTHTRSQAQVLMQNYYRKNPMVKFLRTFKTINTMQLSLSIFLRCKILPYICKYLTRQIYKIADKYARPYYGLFHRLRQYFTKDRDIVRLNTPNEMHLIIIPLETKPEKIQKIYIM